MLINLHDPAVEVTMRESVGEIRELMQFADGVVIDVGANMGSHSINFAKKAQVVYAFEPYLPTFNNLCANLALNLVLNVIPKNQALGAYCGETMMPDIDMTEKHYSMGMFTGNGTRRVDIRTIDSLALSPVHFIKIDCEGFEFEVLRGANHTLQRENPVLFVEIHKPELIDPITEFMSARGYNSREFISYYSEDDEGKPVRLTNGHLFWKEGRIVWAEPHSSPE